MGAAAPKLSLVGVSVGRFQRKSRREASISVQSAVETRIARFGKSSFRASVLAEAMI